MLDQKLDAAGGGGAGEEEGIKVAIRMRPLNAKESDPSSGVGGRVWRVLQKYNSVTETTKTGQPLPERVNGRTFFTFDQTYGERSSTTDVYEGVARGIVQSVTMGLNGTIFAYGQTSSGKTYTMQGSDTIQDGGVDGTAGGVVQMAARDVFAHIARTHDRVFLLRVSYIEIYNEEVRDLLVSGESSADRHYRVLAIREDPRRGVFVNANENIVTDLESLMSTLFAGEKNRSVANTEMNERSSRSHTIFRITVESRKKSESANDEDDEDEDEDGEDERMRVKEGEDDGAVLISTLNLVDLAGSESVRHTGATGDRLKEGGKINQSLLTLSRVIVGLGQPNNTHINFRDSKLTRILQPSLSGNARMAIICCATPSELYLEETRSTLQFASRAKLVRTHAVVNEVLDDRSLIKRLQKELAEALQHMKALETEAVTKERAAREAKEQHEKAQASIRQTKETNEQLEKNLASLSGQLETSQQQVAELQSRLETVSSEKDAALGTVDELREQIVSIESKLSDMTAEKERTEGRFKELAAGNEGTSKLVEELVGEKDAAPSKVKSLGQQHAEAQETTAGMFAGKEELEAPKAAMEAKAADLQATIEPPTADKDKVHDNLATVTEQHETAQKSISQAMEANTSLSEQVEASIREQSECNRSQLGAAKRALANEKEIAVSKVKEDLANVKNNLTNVETELFSVKQELLDAQRAGKTLRDKLSQAGAEKNQIVTELRRAQEELRAMKRMAVDDEKYLSMVKKYEKELKAKDVHIKMLEAHKITRGQCNAVKKMKEERLQFQKEALEYKKRPGEVEQRGGGDKENTGRSTIDWDTIWRKVIVSVLLTALLYREVLTIW